MKKNFRKAAALVVMGCLVLGAASAQENAASSGHKHEPFDVLLGLNLGFGVSSNLFNTISAIASWQSGNTLPEGAAAVTFDLGVTADFYLLNWLSFSSGLLLHPDIYLTPKGLNLTDRPAKFTDIFATPLCLTIPFAAHVNIPTLEWLYVGLGLNLNLPLTSLLDSTGVAAAITRIDTKGKFFVGLPIDIGFDFVKPGSNGGARLVFRITPEFHENGTAVPIGIMWQVWNWKLYSKQ
jgi:hypothetical protein